MWRAHDQLAERLIVMKIENPENQGHLYEIRLRHCASMAEDAIDIKDSSSLAV